MSAIRAVPTASGIDCVDGHECLGRWDAQLISERGRFRPEGSLALKTGTDGSKGGGTSTAGRPNAVDVVLCASYQGGF
jgi:hypothetical protein